MDLCQRALDHLIVEILKHGFDKFGLCFCEVYMTSSKYKCDKETSTLNCDFDNNHDTKGTLSLCLRTLTTTIAVTYNQPNTKTRNFIYKNKITLEFNGDEKQKIIFTNPTENNLAFKFDLYDWYVKFKSIENLFEIRLICLNLNHISSCKLLLDKMTLIITHKNGQETSAIVKFKQSVNPDTCLEEVVCELDKRGRKCGEWFKVWELRGGSKIKWANKNQKEKNELRNSFKWWDLFKAKYKDRALTKWKSMSNENQQKIEKKYMDIYKKYTKSTSSNPKKRKFDDTSEIYCFVKNSSKISSNRLILSTVQLPITELHCFVRPYTTQNNDKYEEIPIWNVYFIKRPRTASDELLMPFRRENGYYTIPPESVVELCSESDKCGPKYSGTFNFDGSLRIDT